MERETGFEPATSTLARSHSTTELFPLARPHTVPHGCARLNPGAGGSHDCTRRRRGEAPQRRTGPGVRPPSRCFTAPADLGICRRTCTERKSWPRLECATVAAHIAI